MANPERGRGLKGARLTFLTRAYCHLCDTMRDALMPLAAAHGAKVRELDVDADPALEAAYGELVPVVLLGDVDDGQVLCHYHLDRARVVAALASG
jgi:thioredoxin reductase (NADPH)